MWLGLGECMARLGLSLVLVFVVSLALAVAPAVPAADAQTSMTVVASGLSTPRGLTFGPDGKLYVAEAGPGGDIQTDWVPPFRTGMIGTSGADRPDRRQRQDDDRVWTPVRRPGAGP